MNKIEAFRLTTANYTDIVCLVRRFFICSESIERVK